jgi:hypothetical protein
MAPAGPLILTQSPEGRLFEIDDGSQFERALDQATDPHVAVVIQARDSGGPWQDLVTFWTGPWRRDHPVPRQEDVRAAGLRAGARQARYVVRSTI